MSGAGTVRPFGRRAFLLELADQAAVGRGWRRLIEARDRGSDLLAGVEELVAGARTILVVADPERPDPGSLAERLSEWLQTSGGWEPGGQDGGRARRIDIPVVYDGPDLDEVAGLTRLSVEEVVSRHAGTEWTVGFLGFAPGFGYLGGGDPRLAVPRRAEPRTAVPAGSVGLAGGMSAVYPSEMPGGWRLIGRTDLILFDASRDPPALLAPGDRVRFRRTGRLSDAGTRPAPEPAPVRAGGAGPVVEVVRPGPGTTVQDRGRIGQAHLGVPRAGAVDPVSYHSANALVGNPPGAAALEATLSGPTLRFPSGGLVGVAGADAAVTVDGTPVTRFPFEVPPGSLLALGVARRGVRVYVAVAGGLDLPPVLGSRSTDTLSGLGPPPLRAGAVIPMGPVDPARTRPRPGSGRPPDVPVLDPGAVHVVRATPGPRADRLAAGQLDALFGAEMTVSPVSDRVGLRTEGLQLTLRQEEELPSEGMVAGAVQVPAGGRPIVLLANHATTGGYPVVAVVEAEDLAVLAQARPGSRVRLEPA